MTQKTFKKINFKDLTWLDIANPTFEQLEKMKSEHGFHDLDLEDCLSENQRSKIDEYDDYLFIILHFPYFDKRKQIVLSVELDIFIKKNLLVTIHEGDFKNFTELYELCKENEEEKSNMMSESSGYLLYSILDKMHEQIFPILDKLEKHVTILEKTVFSWGQRRDVLRDILSIKKNIITMRRTVQPQRTVLAQIKHKNRDFLPSRLEIYFDDVVDKIEKIWANLENLKELIESIQDTSESIISHRTNEVIKILTIFSVVISPLTFLSGLYGMNVALPFANNSLMFFGIIALMTLIVVSMLLLFRFKRWF